MIKNLITVRKMQASTLLREFNLAAAIAAVDVERSDKRRAKNEFC